MTAPDPRLGEIEGRHRSASPGPWSVEQRGDTNKVDVRDRQSWVRGPVAVYVDAGNAEFIANAPADVAYLLAELRKAQDALGRVEAELAATERRTIEDWGYGGHAVVTVASIRAAVAAATGGGECLLNAEHTGPHK